MAVAEMIDKVSNLEDEQKHEVICGVVEQMTVLSLSKLVKALEDKFDVKASGGMMMAMPSGAGDAPVEEEKTSFDVFIKEIGQQKIQVIKAVRAATTLGLKDAKGLVDKTPVVVKEGLSKEEAEKLKADLEAAGATIELK